MKRPNIPVEDPVEKGWKSSLQRCKDNEIDIKRGNLSEIVIQRSLSIRRKVAMFELAGLFPLFINCHPW